MSSYTVFLIKSRFSDLKIGTVFAEVPQYEDYVLQAVLVEKLDVHFENHSQGSILAALKSADFL